MTGSLSGVSLGISLPGRYIFYRYRVVAVASREDMRAILCPRVTVTVTVTVTVMGT